MPQPEERFAHYERRLANCGQSHLLAFWPQLAPGEREQLLADLDRIDFDACTELAERFVRRPQLPLPARLEPAPILPAEPDRERRQLYAQAEVAGRAAVRAGQVAAFTVAGGQGTRLGFDGPKGAFPISPVRRASLFQLFAESLLGVERRYGRRPHWYIMTSPANHAATQEFFSQHAFFGLSPDDVTFFAQGQMPVFLPDGRIALEAPHRVAFSPDGHGGSLRALAASGALADMQARGVDYISYFQVDNPLVNTIDPLFLGLHALNKAELSSKAVTKADDLERVGNFCLADGRLTVIEYTDLPEALAHARTEDGRRKFDAGSIAIHVFSRVFVERLTAQGAAEALPWHRADKKMRVVDPARGPQARETDVVKLETFVFDAIPLARNPLVLYTRREEEFSPVKNAHGVDSAETARRDLARRAARWLEACGCAVPRDERGEPDLPLEISPAYALDAADLAERLGNPPVLIRGQPFLLR